MAEMFRIFRQLRIVLHRLFSLTGGTDVEGTVTGIRDNVAMRGQNMWMLVCSSLLASIGLDNNSVAVIIGAMLISPLMSPILGTGLGVGINDKDLLYYSTKHFGIAVIVSLLTSALYFLLTPLGEPTAELTARIRPTLLDIGVAVFGGTAGIVAGSRKEKSTAIPGVAIATALMPPLCTSGFGLATGRVEYFLGAFYLFLLNSFFISLSTFFVVRVLKFPYKRILDPLQRVKVRRYIMALSLLVTIPSIIIFYYVIMDVRVKQRVETYIRNVVNTEKQEILRWETTSVADGEILKLYMVGEPIAQARIDSLAGMLDGYGLPNHSLRVVQMNIPEKERERLHSSVMFDVLRQIELRDEAERLKEATVQPEVIVDVPAMQKELQVVMPELRRFAYAPFIFHSDSAAVDTIATFLVQFQRMRVAERTRKTDMLEEFLRVRSGLDTLLIVQQAD